MYLKKLRDFRFGNSIYRDESSKEIFLFNRLRFRRLVDVYLYNVQKDKVIIWSCGVSDGTVWDWEFFTD